MTLAVIVKFVHNLGTGQLSCFQQLVARLTACLTDLGWLTDGSGGKVSKLSLGWLADGSGDKVQLISRLAD